MPQALWWGGSVEIRVLSNCRLCQPTAQRQVAPRFQLKQRRCTFWGPKQKLQACPPLSYVSDRTLIIILAASYVYLGTLYCSNSTYSLNSISETGSGGRRAKIRISLTNVETEAQIFLRPRKQVILELKGS